VSTRWFGVSERTAFIVSVSPVISKLHVRVD